jgi:hypothetical protein
MMDGLYQVTTPYLCAGFVVREGRVISCAPILRKRFPYWWTQAVKVSD